MGKENYSRILELYKSGLSKREIREQGFGWNEVKKALIGNTRSLKEVGRIYSDRYLEKNTHELNKNQLDLIYGSLLGDSSLSRYSYTLMFSNTHCDAQYDYSLHMKKILPSGNIYSRIQKSGYKIGVPVHFFSYRNKGALIKIWDVVMINNKKTVNKNWVERINKEALAYWFMDDGTSCYTKRETGVSVTIQFSTYSFSYCENCLLKEKLEDFGIRSNVRNTKNGHVLGVSKLDSDKLIELIKPTIEKVPCMQYKLKFTKRKPLL